MIQHELVIIQILLLAIHLQKYLLQMVHVFATLRTDTSLCMTNVLNVHSLQNTML